MNTIQEYWKSYMAKVLPKDAGAVQVQETQRGFYAGAIAMAAIQDCVGGEDVSEEAAMAILKGVYDELNAFADQVLAEAGRV